MKPRDITFHLIPRMKENGASCEMIKTAAIRHALKYGLLDPTITISIVTLHVIGAHAFFMREVRPDGAWDFKANVYKDCAASGVLVCGMHYDFDMPGNLHYGFVGAALGLPATELCWATGIVQRSTKTSKPEYNSTFGDDPVDTEFIRLGIKLYKQFGLGFDEGNLAFVLRQFNPEKYLHLSAK